MFIFFVFLLSRPPWHLNLGLQAASDGQLISVYVSVWFLSLVKVGTENLNFTVTRNIYISIKCASMMDTFFSSYCYITRIKWINQTGLWTVNKMVIYLFGRGATLECERFISTHISNWYQAREEGKNYILACVKSLDSNVKFHIVNSISILLFKYGMLHITISYRISKQSPHIQ